MANTRTLLGPSAIALVLPLALVSCDGIPETPGLSGTLEVVDFSVAKDQSQLVAGDLWINASGTVDISGELTPISEQGQSITITAEDDVNISGRLASGGGSSGTTGGDLTIVSTNGNIDITQGSFIGAGDGGTGQTTLSAKMIATTSRGEVILKTLTGGAGGNGGTITLRALNGDITIAGTVQIGSGGDGATITVSGEDLLTTEAPAELDNAGGNSGVFTLEASSFNGQPIDATVGVDLAGTSFLAGGQGGNAGDVFWGMDEDGNSTWPDEATIKKLIARAKQNGVNLSEVAPDLFVGGKNGGDAFFELPGRGASVNATGRSATQFGVDGQTAIAHAGDGGDCTSPFCTLGGSGGNATARGGNGQRGENPEGGGGAGGNGDAAGGRGGVGLITDGTDGTAFATGGSGAKGGGECPVEIAATGGRGGIGGAAFADAGSAQARATAGDGGDGGDGENFGGAPGGSLNANAFGGATTQEFQGDGGSEGTICPPVFELVSAIRATSSEIGTDKYIKYACIQGGTMAESEVNCDCPHVHGSITIIGVAGGPFVDPDPQGCGHGCFEFLPEDVLDFTCN